MTYRFRFVQNMSGEPSTAPHQRERWLKKLLAESMLHASTLKQYSQKFHNGFYGTGRVLSRTVDLIQVGNLYRMPHASPTLSL